MYSSDSRHTGSSGDIAWLHRRAAAEVTPLYPVCERFEVLDVSSVSPGFYYHWAPALAGLVVPAMPPLDLIEVDGWLPVMLRSCPPSLWAGRRVVRRSIVSVVAGCFVVADALSAAAAANWDASAGSTVDAGPHRPAPDNASPCSWQKCTAKAQQDHRASSGPCCAMGAEIYQSAARRTCLLVGLHVRKESRLGKLQDCRMKTSDVRIKTVFPNA